MIGVNRRPRVVARIACASGLLFVSGCDRGAQLVGEGAAGVPHGSGHVANPADPAADLYGDQGGEEVLAADKAPQGAPLRAKKDETFFRLSNPRIITNRPGFPAFAVDYEKAHEGEFGGVSLIIRDAKGNTRQVLLFRPFWDKAGTIEVDQPFPTFNEPAFPENMEVYLVHSDQRYGVANQPTFKVSNSAVRGKMPNLNLARNWTRDEADRLRQPPPAFANANSNPNVGHDSPFVGDSTGGGRFRFVDPDHPMLGVEYRLGAWDNEQCVGQLIPVFTRDQSTTFQPRVIAPEGFAVGGVNIHAKRFVDAVQLIYMKLKPNGTLDMGTIETSDWIGYPGEGEPVRIGGDGRRVIGIHCQQGAILNGLALVLDKAKAP